MDTLAQLVFSAGWVQLAIAAANLFLPRKLRYGEELARVSPIVRQVFIVHAVYIVLVLLAFAAICLLHAEEMVRGGGLAGSFTAFLGLFWGLRVLVQLFYYDRAVKRANLAMHLLFTLAFGFLAAVFAAAAVTGGAS